MKTLKIDLNELNKEELEAYLKLMKREIVGVKETKVINERKSDLTEERVEQVLELIRGGMKGTISALLRELSIPQSGLFQKKVRDEIFKYPDIRWELKKSGSYVFYSGNQKNNKPDAILYEEKILKNLKLVGHRGLAMFKLCKLLSIPYSRRNEIKEKLDRMDGVMKVSKYKYAIKSKTTVRTVSDKVLRNREYAAKRGRFLMSRAKQLMLKDKFLRREKAMSMASAEWSQGKNIIKSDKFNWENVGGEYIREMIKHCLYEKKFVTLTDFNTISDFTEDLYKLNIYKILKGKNNVLEDLSLEGDLSYKEGKLIFEGKLNA